MPYRNVPLVNGEYYHVFNRGVGKMPIFLSRFNYRRFLKTVFYYQIEAHKPKFSIFSPEVDKFDESKKIVEIVAYCLMPNHFHFLLRQERENGINEFIRKVSNSYAKYFNIKNDRIGPLFQGNFKVVHVASEEQLLHLSRYIHLNPLVSHIVSDVFSHEWSSYREFIDSSKTGKCLKDVVLSFFKSANKYRNFVEDQTDYAKKLGEVKHLILE